MYMNIPPGLSSTGLARSEGLVVAIAGLLGVGALEYRLILHSYRHLITVCFFFMLQNAYKMDT